MSKRVDADDRYSAEAPKGWGTWYIIVLLILSIIFLGLFIWVEHKLGPKAMMPLSVWHYPGFGLVMTIMFFGWMDFEIITLYMTFLYLRTRFLIIAFKTFAVSVLCCAPSISSPTSSLGL